MKKIIEMKRYDTKTAEEIFCWWNGCSRSDFGFCAETLYLTKNKTWFLHGEGGPNSQYAETMEGGRTWSSGQDIVPLSEEAAAAWLAERSAKTFEEHFAHLAKDA